MMVGDVALFQYNPDAGKWTRGAVFHGEDKGDFFGASVALASDGKCIVVGAYHRDFDGAQNSGAVYVFRMNEDSGKWSKVGYMSGEGASDQYGWAVAMDAKGKVFAVGARKNDGKYSNAGHVRVYRTQADVPVLPKPEPASLETAAPTTVPTVAVIHETWTLAVDLVGEAVGDQFGWSVALSADAQTLAVGSHYNDEIGTHAGSVRIYKQSAGSWNLRGEIDGEAAHDYSGYAIALSNDGRTIAVGAYGNDKGGSDSGHVRLHRVDEATKEWELLEELDGDRTNDYFGHSLDLSADGKTLAVGAYLSDEAGSDAGQVRVYTESAQGEWSPVSEFFGDLASDAFGISVALGGDTLVVGAQNSDKGEKNGGSVSVYQLAGGVGGLITKTAELYGEVVDGQFGRALAISSGGDVLAVGAKKRAVVFKKGPTGDWVKDAEFEKENANEYASVHLSSDGKTLAVGVFSTSAGMVQVYRNTGANGWALVATMTGFAPGDNFGRAVAVGSDGQSVLVGGPLNDAKPSDAGHVRLYTTPAACMEALKGDLVVGPKNRYYSEDGSIVNEPQAYGTALRDNGWLCNYGAKPGSDSDSSDEQPAPDVTPSPTVQVTNSPTVQVTPEPTASDDVLPTPSPTTEQPTESPTQAPSPTFVSDVIGKVTQVIHEVLSLKSELEAVKEEMMELKGLKSEFEAVKNEMMEVKNEMTEL